MKQERETERTASADRDQIPLGTPIVVSTYNVQTLYQPGKFHQLCSGSTDAGVNIVAVQEHRLLSTNPLTEKWSDDKNWLFIHNSASRNRQGGVGLLVAKQFVKCIVSTKCVSDRIISVSFNGNPRLVVTVAHAPTEMANDEDKDQFYESLEDYTRNQIKRHDLHLVLGNLNARLGHAERLLNYCLEHNLRHVQSRFPLPISRMWTWKHPTGSMTLIDHILINSKWTNSLRNCRAHNSVELDSDHRILSAKIKVILRTTKGKGSQTNN